MPFARRGHLVSRSVLKLDKGKNADCLVTISPEQQHAFLYPHIEESTFHHLRWSPPLSREGNVWHVSLHTAFAFLSFTQREKCHMLPLFLYSDIPHSTFHRHSSVPVTADQSTIHTTQGDVKVVQKRTFCRRKKILNICNLSYIPT